MLKRVVVTGLGVISPIGIGKENFWKALIKGKNGVAVAKKIDAGKYATNMAAEVKGLKAQDFIDFKKTGYLTEATQYAIIASNMALEDSGIAISSDNRIGIIIGANTADPLAHISAITFWHKNRFSVTPKSIYANLHSNLHAVKISEYFGLNGPSVTIPGACASGNTSLCRAYDLIRFGHIQAALAGGCEVMNDVVYTGFSRMNAMAFDRCRPFDRNRKGMIVGEGAGMVLVEEMEHAKRRKANIYAEILGFGLATDAYSVAMPDPAGSGGILATKMALKMSKTRPEDVDYINAHGTGTISNDNMEAKVINAVFGPKNKNVLVSSIKSMLGHCMGAASAIEACACALAIERSIIPPNINYSRRDPSCNLNIVANTAVKKNVNIVFSNAFAFGGSAAVVCFAKFR